MIRDPISFRAALVLRSLSVLLLFSACVSLSACGLISGTDEFVINVDSVAVRAPTLPGGAVRTMYHGYIGSNLCAELVRVERQSLPADTLRVRFIGRQENGMCLQMPRKLEYVDSLPNQPQRTVHLMVLQRHGAPLRYDIALPILATP